MRKSRFSEEQIIDAPSLGSDRPSQPEWAFGRSRSPPRASRIATNATSQARLKRHDCDQGSVKR